MTSKCPRCRSAATAREVSYYPFVCCMCANREAAKIVRTPAEAIIFWNQISAERHKERAAAVRAGRNNAVRFGL